jgi:hypothetical protein
MQKAVIPTHVSHRLGREIGRISAAPRRTLFTKGYLK